MLVMLWGQHRQVQHCVDGSHAVVFRSAVQSRAYSHHANTAPVTILSRPSRLQMASMNTGMGATVSSVRTSATTPTPAANRALRLAVHSAGFTAPEWTQSFSRAFSVVEAAQTGCTQSAHPPCMKSSCRADPSCRLSCLHPWGLKYS